MAVYQKEAGVAHGRGFSEADPNGYLAKLTAWLTRPPTDGSPQEFTADAGTNVISAAGHGYVDYDIVRVSNLGGALPGNLAADTNYWVIYVDSGSFMLATTYGNAKSSTEIDITSAGTGTHSVYKYGGGPGWKIVEDKSSLPALTFTADAGTEELTIAAGHSFGRTDVVWVSNSGGALPGGLSASTPYYVIPVSSTKIKLASVFASAGHDVTNINITSAGTGTHSIVLVEKYIVFCDTAAPAVNDIDTSPSAGPPKFIRIGLYNSEAAKIRVMMYCWWDAVTTHSGYGLWFGNGVVTADDADFAYDFRGGDETMIFQSRIGTTWYSCGITEFTGDAELLEGTDKYGILQSGATAGTSVVLQLDTGEAANFTIGNYYFIFDFNNDHVLIASTYYQNWVNCVKVTNVDTGTDQITVDTLDYSFPAGSVIAAYAHRWVGFTNITSLFNTNNMNHISGGYSKMPYRNTDLNRQVFHNQRDVINITEMRAGTVSTFLTYVTPNRKGYWGTEDIYVIEGTEGYGILKNIIGTNQGTMAVGLDGRTNEGKNYLYFQAMGSIFNNGVNAALFLDTVSAS